MVNFDYYTGKYTSEHSIELQNYFTISSNGVDYYNKNNVAIEFKECFANKEKHYIFACKKHQLISSDFVVFCFFDKKFYVLDCEDLLGMFGFKNDKCYIRLNTVKKHKMFKTTNYLELKKYVDSLEKN